MCYIFILYKELYYIMYITCYKSMTEANLKLRQMESLAMLTKRLLQN